MKLALLCCALPLIAQQQFHRAGQDREISDWLLDPATHHFRISHDFTISKVGERYVHSYVRKGGTVAPGCRIMHLDTGQELKTEIVRKTTSRRSAARGLDGSVREYPGRHQFGSATEA